MYGAERQVRSAPDVEIKSEADDRAFSEPSETSKTDVIGIVCALDSGGLIRVNCWLKLVFIFGPRLPASCLKGGPFRAAIYRAAVRPPGGGGWGWVPFQFKVQGLLTNPLLSFQITIQLLPKRPPSSRSQAQLRSRLKSGS